LAIVFRISTLAPDFIRKVIEYSMVNRENNLGTFHPLGKGLECLVIAAANHSPQILVHLPQNGERSPLTIHLSISHSHIPTILFEYSHSNP
jgi:hypothetical protein